MRNTFDLDFPPLFRTTVGFDRLSRALDSALRFDDSGVSYPPFNIEQLDDDRYKITMAVAGFNPDDVKVVVKDDTLAVTGTRGENPETNKGYLYRGIAARKFDRRFQLADYIKVVGADLSDGLLHIDLEREVPEDRKPRVIEVRSSSAKQIEAA